MATEPERGPLELGEATVRCGPEAALLRAQVPRELARRPLRRAAQRGCVPPRLGARHQQRPPRRSTPGCAGARHGDRTRRAAARRRRGQGGRTRAPAPARPRGGRLRVEPRRPARRALGQHPRAQHRGVVRAHHERGACLTISREGTARCRSADASPVRDGCSGNARRERPAGNPARPLASDTAGRCRPSHVVQGSCASSGPCAHAGSGARRRNGGPAGTPAPWRAACARHDPVAPCRRPWRPDARRL